MFGMAIGSFHGFGKKSILTWFSRVKSGFFDISWFFDFTCKSLNSSYIDPRQEIPHIAFIMKIKWAQPDRGLRSGGRADLTINIAIKIPIYPTTPLNEI